jgi:hypothetical protein
MAETTTIQITTEQRDALAARKTYDNEPMKAVIGRLLESEGTDTQAVVDDLVTQLPPRIAEEMEGRLR